MEIFGSYMSDKHTLGGETVRINLAMLAIVSLPCVLGYNIWSDLHIIGGRDVLDSEDFIVSNLLLPCGSLVYLLFCVSKWGWGFDRYIAEVNKGEGLKSFSEAAEENYISQSAISQQVQALERELGFSLLERKNRSFTLTPAGEYFYRKSLILTADYERMCSEAAKIAKGNKWVKEIR